MMSSTRSRNQDGDKFQYWSSTELNFTVKDIVRTTVSDLVIEKFADRITEGELYGSSTDSTSETSGADKTPAAGRIQFVIEEKSYQAYSTIAGTKQSAGKIWWNETL